MIKIFTILGASALALGVMAERAEAKKVFYEINGKRYSYETSDPEQIATARKRIDAANAADAARAKAEAERTTNPLASVFGSPAQQEAIEAKARLDQLIAEQDRSAEARRQRAAKAARTEQPKKQAEDQNPASTEEKTVSSAPQAPKDEPTKDVPAKTASADDASDPASSQASQKPAVKSLSFDGESGIKTVIMTDGSIHEEPFDTNILSSLADQSGRSSLTAYLNGFRKSSPGDTTGSTTPIAPPAAPRQEASPAPAKPRE
jgi:hypothetical protein